ncbi:MAG: hypothetical protein ACOCR6_02680 [archaeon]
MDSNESLPHPRFEPLEAPPGVRLVDPIDGGEFSLLSSEPFDLISRETDAFPVPVDGVVEVTVEKLRTPYLVGVWIRDEDFKLVEQVTGGDRTALEPGRYVIEFSSVQLKVYLCIEGAFEVDATDDMVAFSIDSETEVSIGIRSYHEQPARRITTTEEPRDVMHAISQFRSALKTTSPERSFPTLRGHPPLLEIGEELSIPGGGDLSAPSISIEVPLRWERILPVASLAYYLDAAVVPGLEPRMIVDGDRIPLVGSDGFEKRVERILKHVFTLDTVVRTEGLYNVDLHERSLIEDQIGEDFGDLYEKSLAKRVRAYLDIPFDVVEPAIPEWKLTADIEPEAANVPVLPFMASDLAVVRCPTSDDIAPRTVKTPSPDIEQFFRDEPVLVRSTKSPVRSGTADQQQSISERVFRPEPTDSLMQTFVGDGIPMGATKMTPEAFYRRLDYEPAEPGRIKVDVVNNEAAMSDESVVSDAYGAREWVEFDVTIHEELTREELAHLLKEETDFLHYIGHVEDEGFRCADGHLDARTLSSVEVGAFLLNACNSYAQGRALVDAGAIGGIVTLAIIPNPTATRIGKNLARLLNTGFSIANARSILEKDEQLASRYMVVGDGHANVVESKSGGPLLVHIQSVDNVIDIELQGYPSPTHSVGGLRSWNVEMPVSNCINPVHLENVKLKSNVFELLISKDKIPILYENELNWSNELDLDRFRGHK